MEQSTRYEALTALGRRLVSELGLANDVDTLGRWMAHYLAELIQDAECATDEDRSMKQTAVRDAILALWAHRAVLPSGRRPFLDFEPILRVLEQLAPDTPALRIVQRSRLPKDATQESMEAQEWLNMAQSLDQAAKLLITYCLASAAKASVDPAQEWAKLATEAGEEDVLEVRLARFLRWERDLMHGDDSESPEQRALAERRDKLDAFISLATKVRAEIEERLKTSPKASLPGEI
ncbi:AVAST type 3 anti-phage proein Avs3b [Cupriavidus campinensis]